MAERAIGKLEVKDVREAIASKLRKRELIFLGEMQTEKPNQKHREEWQPIRWAEKWEQRFTTPEILAGEREMLRAIHRVVKEKRPECRKESIEEAIRKASTRARPGAGPRGPASLDRPRDPLIDRHLGERQDDRHGGGRRGHAA